MAKNLTQNFIPHGNVGGAGLDTLFAQLERQSNSYIWLHDEIKRTKSEIKRTTAKLRLFRELFALEGEKVEIPFKLPADADFLGR